MNIIRTQDVYKRQALHPAILVFLPRLTFVGRKCDDTSNSNVIYNYLILVQNNPEHYKIKLCVILASTAYTLELVCNVITCSCCFK